MTKKSFNEVPFEKTTSSTLIPWIIALMVYLSTLALIGAVLMHRAVDLSHPPVSQFILEFPEFRFRDSPLKPLSIEVKISSSSNISIFKDDLQHFFPTASIQENQSLPFLYIPLIKSFLTLALGISGFIGIISVITIIFITHTGLTIHQKIIDILKLVGAENAFIAKQFQIYSFKIALKGGFIGSLLSALSFIFLCSHIEDNSVLFLLLKKLTTELWAIIIFVPLFMSFIVMITARMTVFFTLDKE